ncbi:hypothetical protein DICPUDRAFT_48253 [Dictyostelium purpureum]|uniref:ERCC4 domain-containing protein n=1 Tax=Dictyostelium purpureum TaxID=5786 RepID=F0ZNF2_DICPU|nr:uncharacterized protein DICPUDRAFT_48253 [Dictyostelium purpureum]EGC34520.1 hypothetical protein DICPUDRAFT_48253 [Dictyostelium purpureum]|eukprot:XP_003288956.1 hypothetical protein DICPUDRAFT_48253 [Dictyostelium purpureum]
MKLEFYKEIFDGCFKNDGFVVMGNGLGIHNIILGFLKWYSDSSDLVLFLDCKSNESLQNSYLFYCERLINFGIKYSSLPTLINQEHSGSSKINMYLKGGVYFGSASILVLDFLTKRMPCHLISGIILNNAHLITDTSIEYLLIKLFRQYNKKGFIKAFTNEPNYLVDELGKLQRIMKYLHVGKLFLWPRFHQNISCILDQHPPDLIELSIQLTPTMKKIEESLNQTIKSCIIQLKTKNNLVHFDDDLFDTMIEQQLKPIWSKVSNYSKQLISSIKLLKRLSSNLLSYDCVTFYHLLLMIKEDQIQTWLENKEATQLFKNSQERVYKLKNNNNKNNNNNNNNKNTKKKSEKEERLVEDLNDKNRILELEENPKWNLLYQILKEIENDNSVEQGTTLIFVKDERTVQQLYSYLNDGGFNFLLKKYEKFYENHKIQQEIKKELQKQQQQPQPTASSNSNPFYSYNFKRKRNFRENRKQLISETLKKKKNQTPNGSTLFNMGISLVDNSNRTNSVPNPKIIDLDQQHMDDQKLLSNINLVQESNDFNQFYQILTPPYIVIHPIESSLTILDEIRPTNIIIYDPDVALVRQIEVYKAENPGIPLRVYLMTYSGTEEYRYIQQLNREKNSFEKLIREKSNLVIDSNQEGKLDEIDQSKLEILDNSNVSYRNSRIGGLKRTTLIPGQKRKVIIDSHEFKSSLPVVLHNHGYEIIPLRLEMGDYIASPYHCIERKSVSDLIGSFSSGRLYTQIEAMNRHYRNPILLIEFDLNQPFYFVPLEEISQSFISIQSLSSKLVILTKAFPRLRVIWSRSSYSTANIYDRLKEGQPEPDPSTVNVIPETDDDNYNFNAQDVLKNLPGVTDDNIKSIMDNVDDLYHLSKLSFVELKKILKNDEKNTNLLFNFFNDIE